jgi:hypothetical protein
MAALDRQTQLLHFSFQMELRARDYRKSWILTAGNEQAMDLTYRFP